jgi:hypothetical protein
VGKEGKLGCKWKLTAEKNLGVIVREIMNGTCVVPDRSHVPVAASSDELRSSLKDG